MAERVHGYYFVAFFFGGVILGIASSLFASQSLFSNQLFVLFSITLLIVSLVRFRRVFLVIILLSGMMLGLWRGGLERYQIQDYSEYFGSNINLRGKVTDDTTEKDDGKIRFKLHDVKIEGKKMSGEVWVSAEAGNTKINRSDTVAAQGFLAEGFGSFAASLVRADILTVERTSEGDVGLQARDKFAGATTEILPEPERSLGLGYLLGLRSNLPEAFEQQIMVLGLTHIVVASGYNLTILVAFARRLFVKVSKYLSAMTGAIMIFGFILITGFSPSMSRAGLVAGLSLLAWYYGRKIHPLALLLAAAAVTLLIRPSYIWGDMGWYLSFMAFFGILVVAPLLHHYFWGIEHKPSATRELIIATLAAQLMTLPIILHSFGVFSLYSLPANILILPTIPLCMIAVFIAGLGGLLLPFISAILAFPAVGLLKYCTFVVDRLAELPNSRMEFEFGYAHLIIGYAAMGLFTIFLFLKTKHNFLKDKLIID